MQVKVRADVRRKADLGGRGRAVDAFSIDHNSRRLVCGTADMICWPVREKTSVVNRGGTYIVADSRFWIRLGDLTRIDFES